MNQASSYYVSWEMHGFGYGWSGSIFVASLLFVSSLAPVPIARAAVLPEEDVSVAGMTVARGNS